MKVKHIVTTSAALAASLVLIHAQAATKGAYIGAGLGGSQVEASNGSGSVLDQISSFPGIATSLSKQNYGVAGKLFAGYNFNPYFGLETNYQMYTRSLGTITLSANGLNFAKNTVQHNLSALDLVGKAYLPLEQFDLYALAGVAETFNTAKQKASIFGLPINSTSKSFSSLRPIIGIGANYNVNTNITTGLEFSHIQGKGNINTNMKAVPNANLLTLTGAYNFG